MTTKPRAVTPRRAKRQTVMLEIELPALSDEAAAARVASFKNLTEMCFVASSKNLTQIACAVRAGYRRLD